MPAQVKPQGVEVVVMLPAGPRNEAGTELPEYLFRQDIVKRYNDPKNKIVGGLQLVVPERFPADFDRGSITVPMGLHADMMAMTNLCQIGVFESEESWAIKQRIRSRWRSWNPDFSVFHGATLGGFNPPFDESRFFWRGDQEEWISCHNRQIGEFKFMQDVGINPVYENTQAAYYYQFSISIGGKEVLHTIPATYFSAALGLGWDNYDATLMGIPACLDSEHLLLTFYSHTGAQEEMIWLGENCRRASSQSPVKQKFRDIFQMDVQDGKIPSGIDPQLPHQMIELLRPAVFHMTEPPRDYRVEFRSPGFQRRVQRFFESQGNFYASRIVRNRMMADQAAIEPDSLPLKHYLRQILQLGHPRVYLVAEVNPQDNAGYNHRNPDDMYRSGKNLVRMVKIIKQELAQARHRYIFISFSDESRRSEDPAVMAVAHRVGAQTAIYPRHGAGCAYFFVDEENLEPALQLFATFGETAVISKEELERRDIVYSEP